MIGSGDAPSRTIYAMLVDDDSDGSSARNGVVVEVSLSLPHVDGRFGSNTDIEKSFAKALRIAWQTLCDGHPGEPPLCELGVSLELLPTFSRANGNSAGLAFALAAIGKWCNVAPCFPTFVSGSLNQYDTGNISSVHDLELKCRGAIDALGRAPHFGADSKALILVPSSNRMRRPNRPLGGITFHEVKTLAEAIKVVFGQSPEELKLFPHDLIVQSVFREVDDALLRQKSAPDAKKLLSRLSINDTFKSTPTKYYPYLLRRGATSMHDGSDSGARADLETGLKWASSAFAAGDLDIRLYPLVARAHLDRCVARSNVMPRDDEALVSDLRAMLNANRVDGMPMGPDTRIATRGTLALVLSRLGQCKDAVQLRQQNLSEHQRGSIETLVDCGRTHSYLIWEAARAGDFESSEQAFLDAHDCADSVGQWKFNHYNRFRALFLQRRYKDIVSYYGGRCDSTHITSEQIALMLVDPQKGTRVRHPVCGTRRVIGAALGIVGRYDEATQLLSAALFETEGCAREQPFLAWHGELARLDLAMLEARNGNCTLNSLFLTCESGT